MTWPLNLCLTYLLDYKSYLLCFIWFAKAHIFLFLSHASVPEEVSMAMRWRSPLYLSRVQHGRRWFRKAGAVLDPSPQFQLPPLVIHGCRVDNGDRLLAAGLHSAVIEERLLATVASGGSWWAMLCHVNHCCWPVFTGGVCLKRLP